MLAQGESVFSSLYEPYSDPEKTVNKIKLDLSTLLSISASLITSVIITKEGRAFGIGDNSDNQIHSLLPKEEIKTWAEIIILNSENKPYKFISAVCGSSYTTYILYDEKEGHKLYLAMKYEESQFLNTGEFHPIALYGGDRNSAVIDRNGSFLLISNRYIRQSLFRRFYLPDGVRPVKIACGSIKIKVLGENQYIYDGSIVQDEFYRTNKCFSDISGSCQHFLGISSNNYILGCGINNDYQLGLKKHNPSRNGREDDKVVYFTLIPVHPYNIVKVFAGCSHSLFISSSGNVYKVGDGKRDITHIDTGEKIEFCFEGTANVFITQGKVPENTPNRKINDLSVFRIDNDYYDSMIAFKEKEIESLRERIKTIREEKKRHLNSIEILTSQIEEIKLKKKS